MTIETKPSLRYPGFVDGIDLSEAQVVHDAQAVADDGFVFATVKVSEGLSYADPRALESLKKLRDVGLICNAYTFLRPSQGHPRDQIAKAFDSAGDEFPMRMMLDLEASLNGTTDGSLIDFAEVCVDECLHHGVLYPEFYSFPDFIRTRLQPALARSTVLGECPLFIAHYGSNTDPWVPSKGFRPFVPAPWTTWTKHQYSGNGGYRVRGIYGDCDRDLFNGDLAAFKTYMGLDVTSEELSATVHPFPSFPPPEPPPEAA